MDSTQLPLAPRQPSHTGRPEPQQPPLLARCRARRCRREAYSAPSGPRLAAFRRWGSHRRGLERGLRLPSRHGGWRLEGVGIRYPSDCGLRIAGIEFVEDSGGNRYTYDINGTTNFNSDVEAAHGLSGMGALAEMVERELQVYATAAK